jgi:hypothetical protein
MTCLCQSLCHLLPNTLWDVLRTKFQLAILCTNMSDNASELIGLVLLICNLGFELCIGAFSLLAHIIHYLCYLHFRCFMFAL